MMLLIGYQGMPKLIELLFSKKDGHRLFIV